MLINWQLKQIKRVVCSSSLNAETLALRDAIDNVIFLKHMISEPLFNNNVKIPINVYTDNRSFFDTLRSTNNVIKKRLHIDIAVAKENIENNNIYIYICVYFV